MYLMRLRLKHLDSCVRVMVTGPFRLEAANVCLDTNPWVSHAEVSVICSPVTSMIHADDHRKT